MMSPRSALRRGQGSPLDNGTGHSSAGMRPSSRSTRADGYSLVRSDVEEDHDRKAVEDRSLPNMPIHTFGVQQRTTQGLDQRNAFELDETLQGPMAWVESWWFQGLCGLIICANAVIIGLETDIESPAWFWIEQLLLVYFCFELIVRLMRHGCKFFNHEEDWVWNLFDFSIVMNGVFDQWMMPVITYLQLLNLGEGAHMSMIFMIIRMARLLRIVRLFRLVRIVRPLYELAQGVLEALQGMFWVLVFMVMTLYSVAILCTRLIGHGDIVPEDAEDDPTMVQIRSMFTTVDESMFTLFGTMSSWSLVRFVPLFKEMPFLRPLFVLFYVYSAWALLAVMTGVVSENMIVIREQMVKEDEHREERRKTQITNLLIELFREADADHSGTVSRQEFDSMLRNPQLTRKITKNTHLKVSDLQDLFEWLDHDGGGTITIDEFMDGFKWVNEPLRSKSLVKLQERLTTDLNGLERTVIGVVEKRAAEVQKLVGAPLRKVHAITEQMQSLDVHFTEIRNNLREQTFMMPTPQELREVEQRLNNKLSSVFERLEEIEEAARAAPMGKRRSSTATDA